LLLPIRRNTSKAARKNKRTPPTVPIAIPALAPGESDLDLTEEMVFEAEAAVEVVGGDSAGAAEVAVWRKFPEVIVESLGEDELVEGEVIPEPDVVEVDNIGSIIENTEEFEVPVVTAS
jgi:hypothetical protein